MNLKELHNFKLHDAIFFHNELNPVIFNGDKMDDEVRQQLLVIAEDFIDHLGLDHLKVEDITVSGSNAAYTYTKHSDIDLHILVDMKLLSDDTIYRELFDAKKTIYNDSHDITIGGYDVELYVQDSNQPVISLGEYSVMYDKWNKLPKKTRANLDQMTTKLKFNKLLKLIDLALKYEDADRIQNVLKTIKKYRQHGLDMHGEFGPENLAFKALRSKGIIKKLFSKLNELHSQNLSLPEDVSPVEESDEVANRLFSEYNTYSVNENSGYIPSEKEKNDPRFKTALTVDVKPNSIKDNARKLGSKISRAGIPPLLR
jgi:hypothetical protein